MKTGLVLIMCLFVSSVWGTPTNRDSRTRRYLSPTRVMWTSSTDLITNPELLLAPGTGQSTTSLLASCVLRSDRTRGGSILLDFGRELQGGVQLVTGFVEPKGPVRVRIRLGESASEAMSEITPESGATNDHAIRDMTVQLPWLGVTEVGNSGFRFVRIDLIDSSSILPLREVRAISTMREVPYLGSFRSSDARLDSIWAVGAYTVHLNMQEYLWDGIKRDRLVWLGDMHPEVRTLNAVFGDNEVVRLSLDLARVQTPLPGWMNQMCSYSLWWVLVHRDYYHYHGDLSYLREQHTYLRELLTILCTSVGPDGRERLRGGGRFLDWPTSQDTVSINAGLQALMLMTLRAGAELATSLGDHALSSQCTTTADRMHGTGLDPASSKQSAALLSLSGLVPPSTANAILTQDGVSRYSTFYGYYMLQAQAQASDYLGAMDAIRTYWGGMLDLGATSFWEDFDIRWKEGAGRIDELVPPGKIDVHQTYGDYCYRGFRHSLCHGWASGPTAWLSEHVLGVSIVAPGCSVVRVRPQLGDLQWVEGDFPTPHGVIHIRHDLQADGSVKSKISAPKGVKIVR